MRQFGFGQIILLGFPHTDGTSLSKRPALVISDTKDEDVVVCRITSKIYHSVFDVSIVPTSSNGLMVDSVIRVHKIATLSKKSVLRLIGEIDKSEKLLVCNAFHLLLT